MSRLAQNLLLVAIATVSLAATANAQNRWHFGMNVSLTQLSSSKGLLVNSVSPFGPAARAGLESGDVILAVNERTFSYAWNDHQGLDILQQATSNGAGNGGLPTTMVTTPSGTARMQVLNVRTGRITAVVCYPRDNFGGGGIPTGQPPQYGTQPPQWVNPPAPIHQPIHHPIVNPGNPGCGSGGGHHGGGGGGGIPTSDRGNGNGSLPTLFNQAVQMLKDRS